MCVHWVTHASEGNHRWWCRANPGVWNTLAEVHTVGARPHINQSRSRPGRLANQIARIEIAFRLRPNRSGFTRAAARVLAGICFLRGAFRQPPVCMFGSSLQCFGEKQRGGKKRKEEACGANWLCVFFPPFIFYFLKINFKKRAPNEWNERRSKIPALEMLHYLLIFWIIVLFFCGQATHWCIEWAVRSALIYLHWGRGKKRKRKKGTE